MSGIGIFDLDSFDDMTIGVHGNFGKEPVVSVIPFLTTRTGTIGFGQFEGILFLLRLVVVVVGIGSLFYITAFFVTVVNVQMADIWSRR